MPLSEFLVAFMAASLIVRVLASGALFKRVVDVPNDRSLHAAPTPRTGGLGLLAGAGIGWALSADAGPTLIAALAAALGATFLIDDVRGLLAMMRIALQVAAALIFVVWSPLAAAHWLLAPLVVVGIVWCMNLYNFMDGSNGLAGGMAVFGFGTYALAAHMSHAGDLAAAAGAVAGAGLGFLVWNFGPARIFLGDAGSVTLGFLAAAIGVLGWQRGVWPFWFAPLVFSPFILDATVTLLRRVLCGETVWCAHRSHYYQRLVRMGWSHRRVALTAYGLMSAAAVSALLVRDASPQIVIMLLSVWGVAYAVIAVAIDRRWSAFQAHAAQG